jgi:hypothetical protein
LTVGISAGGAKNIFCPAPSEFVLARQCVKEGHHNPGGNKWLAME